MSDCLLTMKCENKKIEELKLMYKEYSVQSNQFQMNISQSKKVLDVDDEMMPKIE